jgi:hypothetical protein
MSRYPAIAESHPRNYPDILGIPGDKVGMIGISSPLKLLTLNNLVKNWVTGAKSQAGFEILLAPTRVWSIQPDCDRPG